MNKPIENYPTIPPVIKVKVRQYGRRELLAFTGVSALSTAIGICGVFASKHAIDDLDTVQTTVKNILDSQYTLTADHNSQSHTNELKFSRIKRQIDNLTSDGNGEELKQLTNDPEVQAIINQHKEYLQQTTDRHQNQPKVEDQVGGKRSALTMVLAPPAALLGSAIAVMSATASIARLRNWKFYQHRRSVSPVYSQKEPILSGRVRGQLDPQDRFNPHLYLPPSGGKIISSKDSRKPVWYILDPTPVAEQQVEMIKALNKQGYLGQYYIHQLTIQGRLRDSFKFVAMALILNSPYKNDWNDPLYNAPWGKVAPLVHDGGKTNQLNPLWTGVDGRTDFLQRINFSQLPNYQVLLKLDPSTRSELPANTLLAALHEKQEADRLLTESKFYQRSGLALHCYLGSAPYKIPDSIYAKLRSIWRDFEGTMKTKLSDLGLGRLIDIPWFYPTARPVWKYYNDRYEADWDPIKPWLIKLEEIKLQNPRLKHETNQYLIQLTESIDEALGLTTPTT